VHQILGQHKIFQQLKAEDDRYQRILHKIVDKAKGVFLWVFLVVRNLKETLPNEDTVEGLEQIVDDFPSELEDYFERMLDTIPRRYYEPSSTIFFTAMESGELLPLVLVAHIMPVNDKVGSCFYTHSSRKLRTWLKAYCGDLMTVVRDPGSADFQDCVERIDFLHRTVNDYLCSPSIRTKLQVRVQQPYNPSIGLCECSARYLRSRPTDLVIEHPVVELLLSHASKLEDARTPYDVRLVEETRAFLVKGGTSNRDFIKVALRRGLYSYIDKRFNDMSMFDFDATYAMKYVVFEIDFHGMQNHVVPDRIHARMLRILFEHGADPNAAMGNSLDINAVAFLGQRQHSVWASKVNLLVGTTVSKPVLATQKRSVSFMREAFVDERDTESKKLDAQICEIFLEYGADYHVSLGSKGKARDVLRKYLAGMPEQVERFEVLARRWRRRGMVTLMPDSVSPYQNSEPGTQSLDTERVGRRKKLFLNWSSGFRESLSRLRQ
jgi:hypothetical protein